VMANHLASILGDLSDEDSLRIEKLLKEYQLPTSYKIKDIDSFYESFFHDKKASDNSISFILAKGIGDNQIRDDIEKEKILQTLKIFGEKSE